MKPEEQKKINTELEKISKVFNTKSIMSTSDVEQVLRGVGQVMASFKTSTEETKDEVREALQQITEAISQEHDKVLGEVRNTSEMSKSEATKAIQEAIAEVKELAKEVMEMKPLDGMDADEEKVVEEVLKKIKLPEYKETVLDNREQIVEKINSGDEKALKIEAKQIKDLPKFTREVIREVGGHAGAMETPLKDATTGRLLQKDASGAWLITASGAGYTNLTQFVDQTAWRVFYSDSLGDVTELALGASGTFLKSNGASSAPTFAVPAGSGDVTKVGTPVDNQIGVWTGDGTIEGDAAFTFDTVTNFLTANGNLSLGTGNFLGFTGGTTVDTTNYSLFGNATLTLLNARSGGSIGFRIANTDIANFTTTGGFGFGATFYNIDPGQNNMTVEGKLGAGVSAPTAFVHLKAGTTVAATAPLKFNSGALMTAPEAGAVEFLTDAFYATITTGAARKQLAFTDSAITSSMFIGTTSVALNRASAALTLAGITLTTPDIGTPSAGVATNLTGTASGLTAGAVTGFTAGAGILTGPAVAGVAVTIGNTETITGVKTMSGLNVITHSSSGLIVRNPANTFSYTITGGAIAADRILNIPVTTATDTLATLSLAQTFTGVNTMSGLNVIQHSTTGLTVRNPANTFTYTFTSGAIAADRVLNIPVITGTDTLAVLGLAQTFTGVQTFTSPDTTTSITTGSTSFTAWAGATTLLTIGGTGASASMFAPSTLDATSSTTGAIRTSGGISAAKAANIGTTLTVGTTLELGNASDTTFARAAAGIYSVEGTVQNGYTTTATAAGTTTLTIASAQTQFFTGSTTQTCVLPTTSVVVGQTYRIVNNSTGIVTVQSSGANTIQILGAGMSAIFTAIVATPTTEANWSFALNSFTGQNIAQTAAANAATVNIAYVTNTITNNSAATITITLPTAGAIDGEMRMVRVYDFSAVAQTITWVNTQNSTVTATATSNGSTTLPVTIGFQYNGASSLWRCTAAAA